MIIGFICKGNNTALIGFTERLKPTKYMDYVLIIAGFILVIKGSDWLVDGASSGQGLNISDLVIGLTVVAFGTSAPELAINIFLRLPMKVLNWP